MNIVALGDSVEVILQLNCWKISPSTHRVSIQVVQVFFIFFEWRNLQDFWDSWPTTLNLYNLTEATCWGFFTFVIYIVVQPCAQYTKNSKESWWIMDTYNIIYATLCNYNYNIIYICIYTHIFCTYVYIYTSYIRLCIICVCFWLQPQTRNIWRSRSSTTRLLHESLQRSFRRFAAIWRSSERRYKSLAALLTQYDSAERCFCSFILRKNDTYLDLDTDSLYICVYIYMVMFVFT